MSITLVEQVRRLSTEEKREMLEMIQADLAMEEDDVPEWHKEVLESRAREVAEGRVKWLNFDEVVSEWRRKRKLAQ